jgi:hypothetical protein
MRNGSQFICMLFHPGIDGGIPLDSAIESQQFRSHRRPTSRFRDLWSRSTHASLQQSLHDRIITGAVAGGGVGDGIAGGGVGAMRSRQGSLRTYSRMGPEGRITFLVVRMLPAI